MKENPKSILIVKLSAIGDVVHTLPLLDVLRKCYPGSRIDWVVEEDASQIIEGHEAIDQVIVSRRKTWQRQILRPWRHWREVFRQARSFVREFRSREYDLVIDLHGLLKSGILTGIARGRRKIGFSFGTEGSSIFLTEKAHEVEMDQHALERYLQTAEILGCRKDSWDGKIPIRPAEREAIDHIIHEKGLEGVTMVAINPVAKWKTKLWDDHKFAFLADRIEEETPCKVVFTGSTKDRSIVDAIIREMKAEPLNLAGKTTLKELAYLYSRCALLVSTDTGPMHIAAAMKCPVVALFGPTAPWRTGPYGTEHTVIREPLDCSPCFKKRCSHRKCMKSITVNRVFDALTAYLGDKGRVVTPMV
ncbi:MAG: lipopolysaccharide heptosyltransferase I [Deltaproteobacteria bacterium]|nr:lipopolysaccharide heptosyltransferase I [Deltaproteobacteria bacterium]